MIFACIHAFLMLFLALVAPIFSCDYWFNAHAVTIGSMLIYKFWGYLTEGSLQCTLLVHHYQKVLLLKVFFLFTIWLIEWLGNNMTDWLS